MASREASGFIQCFLQSDPSEPKGNLIAACQRDVTGGVTLGSRFDTDARHSPGMVPGE